MGLAVCLNRILLIYIRIQPYNIPSGKKKPLHEEAAECKYKLYPVTD